MIIIADSGSTKTDWAICTDYKPTFLQMQGINPFMLNQEEITQLIRQELMSKLSDFNLAAEPVKLYFYGAGCTPEKAPIVAQALSAAMNISLTNIQVCSDLLGTARCLLQHEPGVACILGTGSNSCYYDGKKITANVSPLGFILGDEGSGAVLGKKLVGNCLKHQFSPALCQAFEEKYQLTPAEIIQRVYREPFPNRFLAGFAPFLYENRSKPEIEDFLIHEFEDFLQRNVKSYLPFNGPVCFVGSIAWYFRKFIEKALKNTGLEMGQIVKSPMEGLIRYHVG